MPSYLPVYLNDIIIQQLMASSPIKTWQPVRFTLMGKVGQSACKEGSCAVVILNQPLEQQKDLLIRICRDEGD